MVDRQLRIIDRLVSVHRADCEQLAGINRPVATPQDMLDDETAMLLRRPFDDLRRLIGQIGGLLLLAEVSGRREISDLAALTDAETRASEIAERLSSLPSAVQGSAVVCALVTAARNSSSCIDALRQAAQRRGDFDLDKAQRLIADTYRMLQRTADPAKGRSMVDFSHACCSCQITPTTT